MKCVRSVCSLCSCVSVVGVRGRTDCVVFEALACSLDIEQERFLGCFSKKETGPPFVQVYTQLSFYFYDSSHKRIQTITFTC